MSEETDTLDLGTVAVDVRNVLKVGDMAPTFELATVDQKSVRLSDLRGKVVLLDFWASWCRPCVAEFPNLKKLREEFASDGKFEIVGLNLDNEIEVARGVVERMKLPWLQGHVGDWSKSELPAQYSVSAIPAKYLVGKDGKIVAVNPSGADLRRVIEKALR